MTRRAPKADLSAYELLQALAIHHVTLADLEYPDGNWKEYVKDTNRETLASIVKAIHRDQERHAGEHCPACGVDGHCNNPHCMRCSDFTEAEYLSYLAEHHYQEIVPSSEGEPFAITFGNSPADCTITDMDKEEVFLSTMTDLGRRERCDILYEAMYL